MAPVDIEVERRHARRVAGGGRRWQVHALLRPGQPVTLVNMSRRAALLESAARLRPGALTEVQLTGTGYRVSVRGRLDRCYVEALEPLRYRGVMVFEHDVELEAEHDVELELGKRVGA